MKTLSKIFALAIFCLCTFSFAANVKINDSEFPVKGKYFSKSWNFSTFASADKTLKLTEEDFAQHPKYKGICGLTNELVLTISAPSKITSFDAAARWCNYANRTVRNYLIEYSIDQKNWTIIADIKHGGGAKEATAVKVVPADNNGTVYIRYRKNLTDTDMANKVKWAVLLKYAKITVNF